MNKYTSDCKITLDDIKKVSEILNTANFDMARQKLIPLNEYEYILRCLMEFEQLKKENKELKGIVWELYQCFRQPLNDEYRKLSVIREAEEFFKKHYAKEEDNHICTGDLPY